MARARNIKPGLYKNEILAELPVFDRMLFIGLWLLADREGRLEDRPGKIKMELFPMDSENVNDALNRLNSSGFIDRYEVENFKVIHVVKFLDHQKPHPTEKDSKLPDQDGYLTVNERTNNGCVTGEPKLIHVREMLNNSELTVKKRLDKCSLKEGKQKTNALNPESLITESLNPLSLNPESLNPEGGHGPAACADVIGYLNSKTGRDFRLVASNTKLIKARIKEGYTLDDIKRVIDYKVAQWIHDDKMRDYLRPATLFNAEKFSQYAGQSTGPLPQSTDDVIDAFVNGGSGGQHIDAEFKDISDE